MLYFYNAKTYFEDGRIKQAVAGTFRSIPEQSYATALRLASERLVAISDTIVIECLNRIG